MELKNSLIYVAGSVSLICLSCKEEPEILKPNVLFILVDDLGYHDLSCMGSNYYETPNTDRIAAEGMIFTRGYSTSQVCSPSRASIMTGKFAARHGITDWIGARAGEEWRKQQRYSKLLPADYVRSLPHEYITLPEAMKEAGYKTFFAGKWHLGSKGSWPEDHGFDINKGGWEVGVPRGGFYAPWHNPNLDYREEGESLTMRLAEETVHFIKENQDTTFFAFLSFYAVHGPIQTTEEKWKKYRQKAEDMGIAPTGFKMGKYLPMRQVQDNPVYAGLVETMDDAVGLVLNALSELGLDKNTIVIFTSDNGGVSAGDRYSTSNLPLSGGKGYPYEGGIRVPFFIKVPGLTKGNVTCDVPVTGADFYPTIMELIGENPRFDEHNDGVSLLPLLKGREINKRPLIWHYPHYGNQGGEPSSMIMEGNWKLIHFYHDNSQELYNMKDDPMEMNDLINDHEEITERLNTKLFNYLNIVGAKYPEKDPEYCPEMEKVHLEIIEKELLPALEKQRMEFLSGDFDPGNNWWGSSLKTD